MADDSKIQVRITDQAGGKTVNAKLPGNVAVSQLLPALVTKMQLPSQTAYSMVHKESGKKLSDSDTLMSAGVQNDHTIRLVPDVTAG